MNRRRKSLWVLLPAAGLCLALGGCQGIFWLVNVLAPPQKVEALFEPPKGKVFLVFVDDIVNPVDYQPIKQKLTDKLNEKLIQNQTAAETIRYQRLVELMADTPNFHELGVVNVGRRLGAEVVLYVQIDRFSLKESDVSPLWKGEFHTTVRVVDVKGQDNLWPTDRMGYPVPPLKLRPAQEDSPSYGETVAQKLADKMADRIANLFHEHYEKPDKKADDEEQDKSSSWAF